LSHFVLRKAFSLNHTTIGPKTTQFLWFERLADRHSFCLFSVYRWGSDFYQKVEMWKRPFKWPLLFFFFDFLVFAILNTQTPLPEGLFSR
jgi:hypothetical protein